LVATVTYPLRRIYGDNFSIAPLSVLVDPLRARRILGLDEGAGFSVKVLISTGSSSKRRISSSYPSGIS